MEGSLVQICCQHMELTLEVPDGATWHQGMMAHLHNNLEPCCNMTRWNVMERSQNVKNKQGKNEAVWQLSHHFGLKVYVREKKENQNQTTQSNEAWTILHSAFDARKETSATNRPHALSLLSPISPYPGKGTDWDSQVQNQIPQVWFRVFVL